VSAALSSFALAKASNNAADKARIPGLAGRATAVVSNADKSLVRVAGLGIVMGDTETVPQIRRHAALLPMGLVQNAAGFHRG